ncbi:MAG TPA: hypothetical protein DCM08_14340 [Microscillaceae bacterium]|nr:hypothetical protein [Microscillaceae bacterium]
MLAIVLNGLSFSAYAQCAMCKAAVENNISNGSNLAQGLNMGILYLASMPYIAFVLVAYFWYKNSLRHKKRVSFSGK